MLAIEEILCELIGEEDNNNSSDQAGLPPGFRFHPTDEELITFYLASKVFNTTFSGVQIAEVDLNRCEPWELPEVAKMGEREWYFFSLRDRKYPTGLRTNRATGAGYWKATGKDREVYSGSSGGGRTTAGSNGGTRAQLLGMKKTLVFYKGRAPRGEKTKWVMHEYRLDGDFSYRHTCKEEWVICRIFHKVGEKKNAVICRQSYMLDAAASSPSCINSLPSLLENIPTTTNNNTVAAILDTQSITQNSPIPPMQSSSSPYSSNDLLQIQNPFLIHHQDSDPLTKSHLPPISFPLTSFSPTSDRGTDTDRDTNNHPFQSEGLYKFLLSLSHQDSNVNTSTILKQCKTEANFPSFRLSTDDAAANLRWASEKFHQNNYYQNPSLFGMDFGFSPSPAAAVPAGRSATVDEMSISSGVALNNSRACFQMLVDPPIKVAAYAESWPLDI